MPLQRPRGVVCVVTARERLARGCAVDAQIRALVEQASAAADASVDLFQIREHGLPDASLLALVERVRDAVRGAPMRVLVNDRLDIAAAAAVDGVHLKGVGIPVTEARRIALPGWTIGASTHSGGEVLAAERAGADYVTFGTVFPTASKPAGHRWTGVDALAEVARASSIPVLAIGGVDAAVIRQVARVAAGVAAIGWFATTSPGALAEAVRQVRSAFDSAEPQHLN